MKSSTPSKNVLLNLAFFFFFYSFDKHSWQCSIRHSLCTAKKKKKPERRNQFMKRNILQTLKTKWKKKKCISCKCFHFENQTKKENKNCFSFFPYGACDLISSNSNPIHNTNGKQFINNCAMMNWTKAKLILHECFSFQGNLMTKTFKEL